MFGPADGKREPSPPGDADACQPAGFPCFRRPRCEGRGHLAGLESEEKGRKVRDEEALEVSHVMAGTMCLQRLAH